MIRRDYNSVNWSEHFYLDETSPSGLRWNRDVITGKASFVRIKIGSVVGNLNTRSGRNIAWVTRVNGKAYLVHRIIWVMVHGYIDTTLVIDHLNGDASDNSVQNMCLKTVQENSQNRFRVRNNTSGVNGVRLYQSIYGTTYYIAVWKEHSKYKSKSFSTKKYGMSEAFRLACEYRTAQIALLNENGANYTERHGSA